MSILAIVFSGIALLFSGYVLWATHLKSFKVEVEIGSPILAMVEGSKGSNMYSLGMVVPIDMVNTGARRGTVKDMLVKLDTESVEYPFWFLHPFFFASEYSEKALRESVREVVHPIYFQGKERIFRNIIFTPILDGNFRVPAFPLSKPQLSAGVYTMTLFVLDSSGSEFRQVHQSSFKLTEERVTVIPSNFPFVPRILDVKEARERFFESIMKTTN